MNNYIYIFDFLSLITALLAIGRVVFLWREKNTKDVKILVLILLFFFSIYCFSMFMEWDGITNILDNFEDYIGALIPMTCSFLLYSFLQKISNVDLLAKKAELRATLNDVQNINKELIIAKDKALESDRLKSAFLANVSHEIRTPMNGIIGFAELLSDPDVSSEKRKFYSKIIVDNSNHLLAIINDILDISRIESDKIEILDQDVDINLLMIELYNFFAPQASARHLEFKIDCGLPDLHAIVRVDRTRLKQVLTNLLGNAFKFTSKGGVFFSYRLDGDNILFSVKDTGIGIPKNMFDKIFEPFRQVELDLTRQTSGTGLGLSISQRLINLMGGEIWLESECNIGSIFYFTIPYSFSPDLVSSSVIENNTDMILKSPISVLIAEDDAANFFYLQELLSNTSVQILHAKNGFEAVELASTNPDIKLVLMDIKMPFLDGYEATRQIKRLRPDLQILAQTAFAMPQDKEKALQAGCSAYISKPIDRYQLLELLKAYL